MPAGTVDWDELVQRSLDDAKQGKTIPTSPIRARPLKLLESPLPIRDETPRTIAGIDGGLRAVIRELVRGEKPWPLFLTGKTGRGKSAAALCLADHVEGALFMSFPRFLKMADWARAAHGVSIVRTMRDPNFEGKTKDHSQNLNEFEFFRLVGQCPLVVFDDVGTRSGYTDPQYDSFYLALSDRAGKPTVVVSNLSLNEIKDAFDERIASRLAAGTVFTLGGEDRRRAT